MGKTYNSIVLFFHDSGMSGGTLALLDLIEHWHTYSNYKLICILPKPNKTLEEKLTNLNCQVVIFRYWQAIWDDSGSFIKKISLLLKLQIGLINTYIAYLTFFKQLSVKAVYSNTSSIYNGLLLSFLLHSKHIWHIREFVERKHGVYPLLGERFHYAMLNNPHNKLVFISHSLADEYRKHLTSNAGIVIYDDVSNRYLLRNDYNWNKRKFNILVVGNISPGKRQLDVLNAFPNIICRHPEAKLFFAGRPTDETYFSMIQEKVNSMHLNKDVIFLGQVDNINEVRKRMGIGVVSSCKEAFGRVTIEGMLADMIMIGADDSATKELIHDSVNGYLFPLNDSQKLSNIINSVLECPEDTSRRIRQKAIAFALEFTSGKCASEVYNLFK